MKFINLKAMSKQKKIMFIGAGVLLAAFIAVFAHSKFQPAQKPESFNSFLKKSVKHPLPVVSLVNNNGLNNASPPNEKKQQDNKQKLNDLFKLKNKKKLTSSPSHIPAAAQVQPSGYPDINNIPNVIRNIRAHATSSDSGNHDFIIIGISGQNAVIQYNRANLYLKAGEAFGSCSVIEIGYSSVKILCGKKARSYPVSFDGNNQRSMKINQVQSIAKIK